MRTRSAVLLPLLLGLALSPAPTAVASAQQASAFSVRDEMIPMRDGVKLHAKIFTPTDHPAPLPFIMLRTPYGVEDAADNFQGYFKELAEEGYVFVFEDIRGRYRSEGTFMMQRPARAPGDTKSIDEGTDTWDTIDWLLKNIPGNNGRVGMLGVSYDGWTTVMGIMEPHPALKAISPQASPADMWLGDDFHHNGAFRLSYGFEYATMMETSKENEQFTFDRYDTFEWYLRLGALSNVNARYLHGKIPTWNDFVNHPDYDEFWKRQTMVPYIRSVAVPTLSVAGWWDQEDFYGPVRIYEELEKYDTGHKNYLVVGPWNHGGWANGPGDKLGDIPFGSATSAYFRAQIQAPWFAWWLKDKGTGNFAEARTFEPGSNQWRSWDAWPPKQATTDRALYFQAGEKLSFAQPTATAANAFDVYLSDPANPVPYRKRPVQATYFPHGSGWYTWLLEDQRFADDRQDVLSWETEPLTEAVTVAGEITAHLFASSSGTDSDWIVKLIDVYPEEYPTDWHLSGWQLMVSNEVFRGRYRKGFEKPVPLTPNAVTPIEFSLHTQDYTFQPGHRIMVQVQSTWFPIIDRNPQTFVPNIFKATDADYRKATQRIYRSARYPSHVTIPVVH